MQKLEDLLLVTLTLCVRERLQQDVCIVTPGQRAEFYGYIRVYLLAYLPTKV